MLSEVKGILLLYLLIHSQTCSKTIRLNKQENVTHDRTSLRPNTLGDDADDIQRQLNNEAKEKLEFGRKLGVTFKNWKRNSVKPKMVTDQAPYAFMWDYSYQQNWAKAFPICGGHSQSPVDLPRSGLLKTRGARSLQFINYDVLPNELSLTVNGNNVIMTGKWRFESQPLIYGGAAHSRRYIFYSLTLHRPSEHTVGGLYYPLETQALHISAEYNSFDDAVDASERDPLAFLGIVTMYKFGNHTHEGLYDILHAAKTLVTETVPLQIQKLEYFCPTLNEYACYQGSLTTPPCTESVLWLVRAKALSVTSEAVQTTQKLFSGLVPTSGRQTQPFNDRKTYYFKR